MPPHGDVFPLPPPAGRRHGQALAPAFASCSDEELRQVRVAVHSLNRLVALRPDEFSNASSSQPRMATNQQRKVLCSILARIRLYGGPPASYSPEAAFSDLVSSKGLYSLEPQNLASFDISKLRVAKGDVVPKRRFY